MEQSENIDIHNKKLRNKLYLTKIIPYVLYIFILAYVSILQLPPNFYVLPEALGGKLTISFHENILKMAIKNKIKSIEIDFSGPMSHIENTRISNEISDLYKILPENEYSISQINEDKTIQVSFVKDTSGVTLFEFDLSDRNAGSDPKRHHIERIAINGIEYNLVKFIENALEKKHSNIHLYSPYNLQNISESLAVEYGNYILFITMLVLLSLGMFQLLTLILSLKFGFIKLKNMESIYIDTISRDFSLHLGFFGTIISLWLSLENAYSGDGDLFAIIEILKKAIFTTVIGFCTFAMVNIKDKLIRYNIK